jgi:hypothetical protein
MDKITYVHSLNTTTKTWRIKVIVTRKDESLNTLFLTLT